MADGRSWSYRRVNRRPPDAEGTSWFTGPARLVWCSSATFVHGRPALAARIAPAWRMAMAPAGPEARRGMRTGPVERRGARSQHVLWGRTVRAAAR
ncbi:hypothetical protein GCM10015535_22480 [Streptomyces gelaticus]|uniref:Uncharacterized protein n=1 Tax=Streptomyces gelaticus TaxID=285446 RepID=A0ABQ2VYM0_9ACTN|nr:hypothetical protein GCM10015535_22480 [Streptomyces gelaticus]